ncbi:MAG: carboxylate--amine ligase [Porticoccaceae bacterium]|nr:carboxylate--amine ligase [Porticoccaceae bacterium]
MPPSIPFQGQPFRSMAVAVERLPEGNLPWLDGVLARVFNLESVPLVCGKSLREVREATWLGELVWRGLLLGSEFLQAAGIPVFEAGYIAGIEHSAEPGSRIVHLAVPDLDVLDPDCLRIAYGQGIKIVEQLMRVGFSDAQTQSLHDLAFRKVIIPLSRRVRAGKSTIPLLAAAHRLGVPFLHVGGGIYQLGWGSRSRKVDRSTSDGDAGLGSRLAQNKVWTASLLRMAGLPAPVHQVVSGEDAALAAARELGWPVVVKPADSDRGEGVTVGVRQEQQLAGACDRAFRASRSKQVIVERQVPGVCHRLFVASGRLLYGVKRLARCVVGDGRHSVIQLIEAANREEQAKPPWKRGERYPLDELAIAAASRAGFAMTAIPLPGQLVPLRAIESTVDGGYDVDVSAAVHADNIEVALRAAELFHLEVAGIDIISTDIGRSWTETGAIINEVNFSPVLGGGEISKSYLPAYLRGLLPAGGRIPIDVHVGGSAALHSAREHQARLVGAGAKCYLSSYCLTLDSQGGQIPVPGEGLYGRCRSLLLNRRVDRIILVLHNDELLTSGLPVDRIDTLVIDDDELVDGNGHPLAMAARQRLLALVRAACPRAPGPSVRESFDSDVITLSGSQSAHSTMP